MKKTSLILSILLLYAGGVWADSPDLKSILEHLEEKDSTDSSAQKKREIFILEKCSAISFAVFDDTEEFDSGDAFYFEAVHMEGMSVENILLVYERVKTIQVNISISLKDQNHL